jgi:four helix bundle protein
MQTDKAKFKQNFIKRLIALTVRGLKFADILRKNRNLWGPADQFVRSLTSIGANVVEAKSASSKRDYTNYFQIALKSANETKFWLLVIKEYSPDNAKEAQEILNEVIEVSKIIGSSILTLKGKS